MTTSPVKLFGEEISPKRRESPRERIARKALEEKNMNSPLFKALQDESNKRELPNKEILKRVEYFQELPKFSPQDLEEIYLHLEHFWSPRRPMEVFQEVKEKKFLSKLMEQGQKEKIIQHFSKIPERLQLYFLSGPL
ncbi:MAG: hypothetical protein LBI53_00310 [Candidatus Peribacteria bacterium]|jgi:hypothetical protein|nr:hypothetical protein [Candidatus Peribacteria bacterium]